jgi:hypothetical protein
VKKLVNAAKRFYTLEADLRMNQQLRVFNVCFIRKISARRGKFAASSTHQA